MIALASNSVLCRLALGAETLDAASFTAIRLLSGALMLVLILFIRNLHSTKANNSVLTAGSWFASSMLFLYAVTFSYAYITLETGTGALVLFGSVQFTMILIAYGKGQHLNGFEWMGIAISFTGFVVLIWPEIRTPSLFGCVLMAIAGIAWGVYTLEGKGSTNPLADTTANFVRSVPLVVLLTLLTLNYVQLSTTGILLAIASGALASGLGYTIWYTALRDLTTTQAAIVQLTIPLIAAAGGVLFVSEVLTLRLITSAVLILCGILVVKVWGSRHSAPTKTS
ncbi:DMT family transporter [Aestuariicella sp. G3-2]|nr:DMT family transporter [Aestuariicella albida]